MVTLRLKIRPKTAFGSALIGETLFGQLCWAVVRRAGKERLAGLLAGYTEGRPFAVLSDAFPSGYVHLPTLPVSFWTQQEGVDRKAAKKKVWLPLSALSDSSRSFRDWRNAAMNDAELMKEITGQSKTGLRTETVTMHNTVNRMTGTTGEGLFAPYVQGQTWLNPDVLLDIYAVIDEERFGRDELADALEYVGLSGYGRDSSVGLGKFELTGEPEEVNAAVESKAKLTLASSVLSGVQGIDAERTFYLAKTHFGRHGEVLAVSENPFKKPVLCAAANAFVVFANPTDTPFVGRGIAGLSSVQPEAVYQGYAPVLPVAAGF